MNKRLDKKAFELQFSWIFAVIVGAVVLFLMLYFVTKFIGLGEYKRGTEAAVEISILLEPFRTTIESTKSPANIEFPSETRLYNRCSSSGTFGEQSLSTSFKSFGKWSEKSGEISTKNQYIFSEGKEEGKTFYIFSMPFKMPFKIADIMILSSKEYCFVQPPGSIEEEIQWSDLKNIRIDNCSSQDVKVCFGSSSGCDISVYGTCQNCDDKFESGYILKDSEQLYYVGPLIYGAIIADKDIYDCNVKRLLLRLSQLALLYKNKAEFLGEKCNLNIAREMALFSNMAKNSDLRELYQIEAFSKIIGMKNDAARCNLF